jgi:hypothetical protein
MNILLLAPMSAEADLNDLDYGRCLETYGAESVWRLDPGQVYREEGMRGLEARVSETVRQGNIATVFYWLGPEFDFRPDFLFGLSDLYRVLVLGDDEYYFDVSHRYYAQCCDLVLTNNPLCERFHLYGIDALFLPNVFRPALFSPGNDVKDIDVSFVGAMRGKTGRHRFASALQQAGIAPQVFGSGTSAGMISQQAVIDVYRRTRVNLNFTGGSSATPLDGHLSINRRVRQVKGRNTKIALCGSFVLSERAPGLERLFDIGREIDVFEGPAELVEKARFYLQHEDVRETMALRAHQRAVRDYDEAAFWPRMLETIRARMRRKRKLRAPALDRSFRRAYAGWRFKYLAFFVMTARWRLFFRELALVTAPSLDWRVAAWSAYYGVADADAQGARLARRLRGWARALLDRRRAVQ